MTTPFPKAPEAKAASLDSSIALTSPLIGDKTVSSTLTSLFSTTVSSFYRITLLKQNQQLMKLHLQSMKQPYQLHHL